MTPMLPVYDSNSDKVRFVDANGDHWKLVCENQEPAASKIAISQGSITYEAKNVGLVSDSGRAIQELTEEAIDLLSSVFDMIKKFDNIESEDDVTQVIVIRRDRDSKRGILLEAREQEEIDKLSSQANALGLDIFIVDKSSKKQKQKTLTAISN